MVIRRLHVDAPLFHLQHANVLDLRRPGLVVLFHTRVNAFPTANAATQVESVGQIRLRPMAADP